jgi:citrate lyase subunit beta / citryl-CoA lyase
MTIPLPTVTPLRRSLLSVPSINQRALDKIHTLDCDGVIFDLEDSVSLDDKQRARDNLRALFRDNPLREREAVIRINPLAGAFGRADLDLVLELSPNAVALPKVDTAADVEAVQDLLDRAGAPSDLRIWAMMESALGVLNAGSVAAARAGAAPRLDAFVVGLNDLRKETGIPPRAGRQTLVPLLMPVVLAARAYGLGVIDSVFNDFRDADGFEAECAQGRDMGFDGKMLIHPAQIDAANRHFGPEPEALAEAEAVIAAFAAPEAASLNVINLHGRMVERLHLVQAEALIAQARRIAERKANQ